MSEFEKLKEKYNQIVRRSLDANKSILIESFVEHYGEEFRDIITSRYNEIIFCFYVDFSTIDHIVNDFIPKVADPEKYKDFINFRNSHKKTEIGFLKEVTGLAFNKLRSDEMIGITDEKSLKNFEILKQLISNMKKSYPATINYHNGIKKKKIITFPILLFGDQVIIHEINHAIVSDILALFVEKNEVVAFVEKSGLIGRENNSATDERNLEELINEKSSIEITEIFKRRGGNFSGFCFDIFRGIEYKKNYWLIDDFYNKFKELLKKSRITGNKNLVIQKIGKQNYLKLLSIIEKYYKVKGDKSGLDEVERAKFEINELIYHMEQNFNGSNEFEKQGLKEYYDSLRAAGYKVTPFEDSSNNSPKR